MSPDSFVRYQFNISDYMLAVDQQNADISVSADGEFSAVEVPIISPERLERIVVSVNETRREVLIDDKFNYPDVLWIAVEIDPCQEATIEISLTEDDASQKSISTLLDRFRSTVDTSSKPGLPAIDPVSDRPPVFLISIDTLPYDVHEEMAPLLEEMGPTATVPDEPRTQGFWTPPSHGSMFTGTHPGDHGYVGVGNGEGDERPMHPEMETIASVLTDCGYKNSALISHGRIQPEYGFGRGFHRFVHDGMGPKDWIERSHGVRKKVDTLLRWIDHDTAQRENELFYFIHLFDTHGPFVPPLHMIDEDSIDLAVPWKYAEMKNEFTEDRSDQDYVRRYNSDPDVDDELVEVMKSYHSLAVRHTARQVARLIRKLKSQSIYENALIIITGDHGEEFAERGFFSHTSLYDKNIRPFMIVKPPRTADWEVRDAVDTIDFLPTVSTLVGADTPTYCRGRALQEGEIEDRVRISERLSPDWYNIAVEQGDNKAVLTYESNYPERAESTVTDADPELSEFYSLSAVRDGEYESGRVPDDAKEFLKNEAESFLNEGTIRPNTAAGSAPEPVETEKQLELLGYK